MQWPALAAQAAQRPMWESDLQQGWLEISRHSRQPSCRHARLTCCSSIDCSGADCVPFSLPALWVQEGHPSKDPEVRGGKY